jgi:hypothetical protein
MNEHFVTNQWFSMRCHQKYFFTDFREIDYTKNRALHFGRWKYQLREKPKKLPEAEERLKL